jgi:hypothetical protein
MRVNVILVHVMQMTIVKVAHMAVMPNGGVAAVRSVLMRVVGMMLLGAGRAFTLSSHHILRDARFWKR